MKLITIKAFIGSNNETKELEIDKIASTLSKNHEAFTLQYPVFGYCRVKLNKQQYFICQTNAQR